MTNADALRILGLTSVPDQATLRHVFTKKNQTLLSQMQRSSAMVNKNMILADMQELAGAYNTLQKVVSQQPSPVASKQSGAKAAASPVAHAATMPPIASTVSASAPTAATTGQAQTASGTISPISPNSFAQGTAPVQSQSPAAGSSASALPSASNTGKTANPASKATVPLGPVPPSPASVLHQGKVGPIVPFPVKLAIAAVCIITFVFAVIAHGKNQYEQSNIVSVPYSSSYSGKHAVRPKPVVPLIETSDSFDEGCYASSTQRRQDVPVAVQGYNDRPLGASVMNLTTNGHRFADASMIPPLLNTSSNDVLGKEVLILNDGPRVCMVQVYSWPVSTCLVGGIPLGEAPSPRMHPLLAGRHVFSFFIKGQSVMQFETTLLEGASHLIKADLQIGTYTIERIN